MLEALSPRDQAPTLDVVSLGKACSILQKHPATIQAAAKSLGIEATVRINHVDHYDAVALERIAEHLQQNQTRVTSKTASRDTP